MITNRYGLPREYQLAVINDPYTGGQSDMTVTGLINPVRMMALKSRYRDEIKEDVSDRLFMLDGQAHHIVLERSGQQEAIVEARLFAEVEGWQISGQFDHLRFNGDLGILSDHKNCKAYALKNAKEEWTEQLNLLRWLIHKNLQWEVRSLRIKAKVRDYSKTQAKSTGALAMLDSLCKPIWDQGREPTEDETLPFFRQVLDETGYPPLAYFGLYVPVWTLDKAEDFAKERVTVHKLASNLRVEQLPLCTPSERWSTPEKWAVMKNGAKRATKLFDKQTDAEVLAAATGMTVEHRPSKNTRCESFCSVSAFCDFGRKVAQ